MSTQPDTTSDSAHQADAPALGARHNFWGSDESDDPDAEGGHAEVPGTDAPEQKARELIFEFEDPICTRTLNEPPWNGGRTAELVAWLCDDEHIDGRGDQLHREQTEQPLSKPALWMPRQREVGGQIIDHGAHRCRRRYNPETGYVNWGETTGTGVPEFDYDTYQLCVDTYLAERAERKGVRITGVKAYLEHAERLWHDPSMGAKDSLAQFIRWVREQEQDTE